jgi:hypothetical protein
MRDRKTVIDFGHFALLERKYIGQHNVWALWPVSKNKKISRFKSAAHGLISFEA